MLALKDKRHQGSKSKALSLSRLFFLIFFSGL
jgi:hypothetical protein